MTKPTIRELLGWFTPEFLRHQDPQSVVEAGAQLAERVEAVLELIGADPEAYEDAKTLAMAVRRALDGER